MLCIRDDSERTEGDTSTTQIPKRLSWCVRSQGNRQYSSSLDTSWQHPDERITQFVWLGCNDPWDHVNTELFYESE